MIVFIYITLVYLATCNRKERQQSISVQTPRLMRSRSIFDRMRQLLASWVEACIHADGEQVQDIFVCHLQCLAHGINNFTVYATHTSSNYLYPAN